MKKLTNSCWKPLHAQVKSLTFALGPIAPGALRALMNSRATLESTPAQNRSNAITAKSASRAQTT